MAEAVGWLGFTEGEVRLPFFGASLRAELLPGLLLALSVYFAISYFSAMHLNLKESIKADVEDPPVGLIYRSWLEKHSDERKAEKGTKWSDSKIAHVELVGLMLGLPILAALTGVVAAFCSIIL